MTWTSDCGKARIIQGDCLQSLRAMPSESVHCCVTSPPYWGLRDYGCDGQLGLEQTPEAYVANMVEVFCEVRRVLRNDGTLWLNLVDSYNSNASNMQGHGGCETSGVGGGDPAIGRKNKMIKSLKPKDLVGIPWRVAFALQADGWWLRQDIIWHKPNPMPESVTDRCTKAHEYVFLLSKSERYYYDAEAVMESRVTDNCAPVGPSSSDKKAVGAGASPRGGTGQFERDNSDPGNKIVARQGRNRRSVWSVATKPYSGAHFATMPPDLVEPCVKAGCPENGIVLDPFSGSGTTIAVALSLGRLGVGCELNPEYIELAKRRIEGELKRFPLFEQVEGPKQGELFQ